MRKLTEINENRIANNKAIDDANQDQRAADRLAATDAKESDHMPSICQALTRWCTQQTRSSAISQPSANWKDYWVQKSIDQALKKPDELRGSLNNLRHTTYITVAISAGLLVGVIGTVQILYPDNPPAWRPYLMTIILYILGWLSVLCATLYIHYPIKSISMDIHPEKVLQYATRDQADTFIKGIQERVESSRQPLTRRAIAVKVSIVSVAVQMASIVSAAIEGIVP